VCVFIRYKKLAANNSDKSPLITLANNLYMPAMLVAKMVVGDHIQDEKLKDRQQRFNNDESSNSSILNDSGTLLNDSSTILQDGINKPVPTKVTEVNVDFMLSQQLKWLSARIRSLKKVTPVEVLNQSFNSSTNSNSSCSMNAKNLHVSIHQLCTSTWLIRTDPQLAYQVYKCSIVDSNYGSCIEFIKRYFIF
jgi:hypothetical protein